MNQAQEMAKTIAHGIKLSETPMGIGAKGSLLEAKGWKEMVEGIKDERKKALVSLMLENYRNWRNSLDEATSTLQVGNFDKWAFPIISIIAENLIAQDLVSVQPLQGPSGNVFFMNFVTGQQKGKTARGESIWDARTGHADRYNDSDSVVEDENLGVTASGDLSAALLAYTPVMPGTVHLKFGDAELLDDGNGILLLAGVGAGTIDYSTGAVEFESAEDDDVVLATYHYNSELNPEAQEMDFEVVSSPIVTKQRKMRGRWSTEAAQALDALHGANAEDLVSTAITNNLKWEIDRDIIEDLRRLAGAGVARWDARIPEESYISFSEHKLSFIDALVTGSSFIYRATNRVRANWVLTGIQGSNVIETLPAFEPANVGDESDGICLMGTLGRLKVYSDPHFNVDELIMGYKGNDLVRTGYIFAPWIMLYSTMLVVLDDFMARKGFASNYGKKPVNSKYYSRVKLSGFDASFGGGN